MNKNQWVIFGIGLILISLFLFGCQQEVIEKLEEDQTKIEELEEDQTKIEELEEEQANEKVERSAQLKELFKKIDEQHKSEQDLIFSIHKSSKDSLMADCKQETGDVQEACFDKVRTLIDVAELVSKNHISEWASLKKDLLFYASNTQRDLQEVYQNASNELARDAEEGIQKIQSYGNFRETNNLEPQQTYKVTKVIDGDTIEIDTGESVRLIGINAPEVGEDCYEEAKKELENLILGKEVTLEADVEDKDEYGRLLRYVYADFSFEGGDIVSGEDEFINYGMVFLGLAYKYEYGQNTNYSDWFEDAESLAKEDGRGCLWENTEEGSIICSHNHYNCADFNTQAEAQAVMFYCKSQGKGDIHYLDGDKNGVACESLL